MTERHTSMRPQISPNKKIDKNETRRSSSSSETKHKRTLDENSPEPPTKRKVTYHFPHINGCRSSDNYEKIELIGEGTYGTVYKAKCKRTSELVALKKIKLDPKWEGFPITSIRETITLLKSKHPNVIDVREIVFGNKNDIVYLVMDHMDRDLKSFMTDMSRPFKLEEVKMLMQQLLSAIAHLHENWILHRDLKSSNLLIQKGHLKVGDFGLAREYGSPLKAYTNKVVTLWYRAPELLLQTGKYSTPIDIWSIGCLFGEILRREPLFKGNSEINQIETIFKTLGSPTEELWPDFQKVMYQNRIKLPVYKYNRLLDTLTDQIVFDKKDEGFKFWNKLLAYDPGVPTPRDEVVEKRSSYFRITAKEALNHQFFKEEPRAIHPSQFPTFPKI